MNRILILGTVVLGLFASCGQHDHAADGGDHSGTAEGQAHASDDIIYIDPAKAAAAGIRSAVAEPGEFYEVIPASGRIMAASGEEATAVATSSGIVSFSRPLTEGMAVSGGTPLFTIVTSGLPEGDVSKRASITYESARKEFERAEKLVGDKIISEKEYLVAKTEYENARLAYEAVKGSSNSRGVAVKAPRGGYVKECLVREGDYVNVGQPMAVVTGNKSLYLRAEVAERDYASLGRISSARFKTAYDGRTYDLADLGGRIVASARNTGAESTFVPVTFEFDNRGGVVPGAYADVYLVTGVEENVISVPETALTEQQGVYHVYVEESPGHYARRDVKTGRTDGKRVEILDGIKAGERIVEEGAVRVRLAGASASIPGHNHNH